MVDATEIVVETAADAEAMATVTEVAGTEAIEAATTAKIATEAVAARIVAEAMKASQTMRPKRLPWKCDLPRARRRQRCRIASRRSRPKAKKAMPSFALDAKSRD